MRRRTTLGVFLALAMVVLFALISRGRESGQPLRVAAAADLHPAFTEIGRRFEAETGRKVVFIFGSTGLLMKQIEQGAPVDVFAAADAQFVDKLDGQGLLLPGSKRLYAYGRLALVMGGNNRLIVQDAGGNSPGAPGTKSQWGSVGVRGLSALLDPRIRKVAIANPSHAPYGWAARQVLLQSGLWERLEPKLIYARDVLNALQYVQTGNVDAAFVAVPLLAKTKEPFRIWVVESNLYAAPRQTMAIIGSTKQVQLSKAFVDFVNGPKGRRILGRYGFRLP